MFNSTMYLPCIPHKNVYTLHSTLSYNSYVKKREKQHNKSESYFIECDRANENFFILLFSMPLTAKTMLSIVSSALQRTFFFHH